MGIANEARGIELAALIMSSEVNKSRLSAMLLDLTALKVLNTAISIEYFAP